VGGWLPRILRINREVKNLFSLILCLNTNLLAE
jgi:hypothetical protein